MTILLFRPIATPVTKDIAAILVVSGQGCSVVINPSAKHPKAEIIASLISISYELLKLFCYPVFEFKFIPVQGCSIK